MSDITEKKKRGRRKKEEIQTEEVTVEVKKRGRKPKGGKLTVKQVEPESNSNIIVNVISIKMQHENFDILRVHQLKKSQSNIKNLVDFFIF